MKINSIEVTLNYSDEGLDYNASVPVEVKFGQAIQSLILRYNRKTIPLSPDEEVSLIAILENIKNNSLMQVKQDLVVQ